MKSRTLQGTAFRMCRKYIAGTGVPNGVDPPADTSDRKPQEKLDVFLAVV